MATLAERYAPPGCPGTSEQLAIKRINELLDESAHLTLSLNIASFNTGSQPYERSEGVHAFESYQKAFKENAEEIAKIRALYFYLF